MKKLSLNEARKQLGCSYQSIKMMIANGQLKAQMQNTRLFTTDKWLDELAHGDIASPSFEEPNKLILFETNKKKNYGKAN